MHGFEVGGTAREPRPTQRQRSGIGLGVRVTLVMEEPGPPDQDQVLSFGQHCVDTVEPIFHVLSRYIPEREVAGKGSRLVGSAVVGSEVADIPKRTVLRRSFK